MRKWIDLVENQQQLFIRFGEIPKDERSSIGSSPTWVHNLYRTSDKEQGVSVYFTHWDTNKQQWVIEDVGNYASVDELIDQASEGHRKIYIVTGDLQDESGIDGEPLIRNVKIVKTVNTVSELLVPGFYDGKEMQPVTKYTMDEMVIFYPDGTEKREHNATITDVDLDLWLGNFTSYNSFEGVFENTPSLLFRDIRTKDNNYKDINTEINQKATEVAKIYFGRETIPIKGTMVIMKNPTKTMTYV